MLQRQRPPSRFDTRVRSNDLLSTKNLNPIDERSDNDGQAGVFQRNAVAGIRDFDRALPIDFLGATGCRNKGLRGKSSKKDSFLSQQFTVGSLRLRTQPAQIVGAAFVQMLIELFQRSDARYGSQIRPLGSFNRVFEIPLLGAVGYVSKPLSE